MTLARNAHRWPSRFATAWLAALLLAVLSFALPSPARAVDEKDLLPVDQAFALSATAPQRDRIELRWKIAPGYYLYRHRISVQVEGGGFAPGTLQMPRGDRHHDEFFGDVETYRGELRATLPGAADAGASRLVLKVKYQGCADAGVCYPPQTRTVAVALPAAAGTTAAAPASGATDVVPAGSGGLPGLLPSPRGGALQLPGAGGTAAGGVRAPLPDTQAFVFEAIADGPGALLLRFTPAQGYYLYRDRSSFRVRGAPGIAAGKPRWPAGVLHRDEHFGRTVVYFDQVDVPLPLRRPAGPATKIAIEATFQGCQTGGICYPPMTRSVAIDLPAAAVATNLPATPTPAVAASAEIAPDATAAAANAANGADAATAAATAGSPAAGTTSGDGATAASGAGVAAQSLAEDSRLARSLSGHGRWLALLGFFGAGLLLAFTPCVLPMIPILSGLIAGQGTRLGTGRALWLSFVYVLANALVFTAAGVVAGLLGANLQAAFQKPWIIGAFAALFIALALSSFGLYELQLPRGLRSRLGLLGDRQRGGSVAGVAAMGALSALIVGPCVAPPLAAAVLYIGQSHDPVLGGAALFLLAMGMGAPLLVFGAAAGRGLPANGPWMIGVQRVFGFLFVGLAVWMLSRILPPAATLALWGLLALAAAAWASTLAPASAGGRAGARFAMLVLAVLGAGELFGALAGGTDPLRPLAGLHGAAAAAQEAPAFRTIKSSQDLDRELAAAAASGTPVLFDFYADWCVSCKEMERYTFTDPAVEAAMRGFVLLKADVTANDDVDQALMERFGILGPPGTLFFAGGRELRTLRLVGFEKAPAFRDRLQRAAAGGR
jgi:thiol:disulfide interchange protein DsbD